MLLAKLSESGVLIDDQLEKIKNITRNETMREAVLYFLVFFLSKRGPKAFNIFLGALRASQQIHVAEHLQKWLRNPNECSEDPGAFGMMKERSPWTTCSRPKRPKRFQGAFSSKEIRESGSLRFAKLWLTNGERSPVEVTAGHCVSTLTMCFCISTREISLMRNRLRMQFEITSFPATTALRQAYCKAKNVLIIVDAFDEANAGNRTLDRLIEGDILRHKLLLIASRPNFLQNKLSFFDSKFKVEGYDKKEQLEHVKRYAEHLNIDHKPFISMLKEKSIHDLCNNPFNLTLLCLLREEDTQLMITRTALYTAIHHIIKRKASGRMDLTEAEVEESLLRPLYQMAFEAHQRNETVIRQSDFNNIEH
ncbi:hypothetical protein CAPTEDRAFT_194404 [Capitella teleta]|uniref:CARD domain-containing protein n=1 Tax=Capitella teleta TaxID=283909 RepID=R7THF1_CAPTE|nr:hypothetical protein CAPTEDRAFT_194404 [Capitella teleta]|eukprot:ELT92867.1 hypothetical protein CAPTEDRAFT_194404 [Capitella teleta]